MSHCATLRGEQIVTNEREIKACSLIDSIVTPMKWFAPGAPFNNPTVRLSRVKVRQKRLELPSRDEFQINAESLRVATIAKARN